MSGPGLHLFGEEEAARVAAAVSERHLSRYRFDDPDAVSNVLEFERAFGQTVGVPHVVGMNSCTSALVAGLHALEVCPGDEVIVPGYTFIASIAAICLVGARPVLAEIDESLTLCPHDVAAKVTPRTKAIMAVHMMGCPADLGALRTIAADAGCSLIEDVAQACGGSYRGARLGSIGDFGAFSLNTGKVITAGDGGILTTHSSDLYRRAYAFHDHGFSPHRGGIVDEGPTLGMNLRMHELAGALAVVQLGRLEEILTRCRALKAVLLDALEGCDGVRPRRVLDPGECGTTHVVIFDDPHRATAAAKRLGGAPLAASPKHNYRLMAGLHREFHQTLEDGRPAIEFGRPGDLPRTDDLLARSLGLSVGVVDGYLGTLGGLSIGDDPDAAASKGRSIRDLIEG